MNESTTIEGHDYACPKCAAKRWVYLDDHDNGDWVEATYKCAQCGHIEYVELPD
jgi:DNA-directed RNA polymerase subunit RPC12/RpoP